MDDFHFPLISSVEENNLKCQYRLYSAFLQRPYNCGTTTYKCNINENDIQNDQIKKFSCTCNKFPNLIIA